MFEKSVNNIISFLKCDHDLDVHINDIKAYVQIFVSEYIFRDRSISDLREMFSSLFSKDINIFPFPKEVISKEDREKFIRERDLDKQFKGLGNFLAQEPDSCIFYLKVYGAHFDKDFLFNYDKVTFYSNEHETFEVIKAEGVSFFKDIHKYFVASVKLNFFSQSVAIEEARGIIKKELIHLCLSIKRELIVDSTKNYLVSYSDGGKLFEAWSSDRLMRDFDLEILEDLNDTPFIFLKRHINDAQKHLLGFEYLLMNAHGMNSMPDYWHYLETLLQLGNDDSKIDKIIEKVSTIAITEEKKLNEFILYNTLNSTFRRFDFPYHKTNFTEDDLIRFSEAFKARKMPKEVKTFEYPFIKELINSCKMEKSPQSLRKSRKYYASILREAYEQRNFFQHQALANQKSLIKLRHTFPWIIQRFRWAIFDEIRLHDKASFTEVVDILYKKGIQLCR
ncbi:hypothetical protein [Chitinophaga filiformis]|uniref:Apea-like HEPN domain-containing protein n=1 Tax=Chitinophaga filiformis TaxID=104663 RepID=A0A1G7SLT4_CHIFI|nr:hypothetical protein [Chitinophaga filiformis]SDG23973.1 hypothetical protein SAMN04488121_103925 [Chitinophaga filiformis]